MACVLLMSYPFSCLFSVNSNIGCEECCAMLSKVGSSGFERVARQEAEACAVLVIGCKEEGGRQHRMIVQTAGSANASWPEECTLCHHSS